MILRRARGVTWRRLPDGAVVHAPERTEPLRLNEQAAEVWDLLALPGTPDEIVSALAEVYAIPPEQLLADVTTITTRLLAEGILAEAA